MGDDKIMQTQNSYFHEKKHLIKQTQPEYLHMICLFTLYPHLKAHEIKAKLVQAFGDSIGVNWINYRRRELGLNTVPVGYPKGKARSFTVSSSVEESPEPSQTPLQDCVGLLLLDELIKKYAVNTLQLILEDLLKLHPEGIPVHFLEKMRDILLIFGSGKVKRLSQYEPFMLGNVSYSMDTLLRFLDQLSQLDGFLQIWNQRFLEFWCQLSQQEGEWDGWLFLDGHGKSYFSKKAMVCGKVSCSDRIMPITKSVMAHLSSGICIWYESTAPNRHYGETFLNMAIQVNEFLKQVGLKSFSVVCTDREGNSKKKGLEYSGQNLRHLSCLKSNEYKGLEDFKILHEQTDIYVGIWKDPSKHEIDPRTFVIRYYIDHWVVFSVAGLEDCLEALPICKRYSSRQEVQENAIKEQISQQHFNMNYGNKLTEPFDVETKAHKALKKKEVRLRNKKAKIESSHPKQKRTRFQKEEKLKQLDLELKQVEEEYNGLPKKRVQDRNRQKDDVVSVIKLLGHNIVLLLGILVGRAGISERRTEKINKYILRRSGYVKEFERTVIIYLLAPHRKKTHEEIQEFLIAFNKLDFIMSNGKRLKLEFVGET